MTTDLIKVSTPSKEGVLQASKWLYVRMLLDPLELEELSELFKDAHLLNMTKVCQEEEIFIRLSDVLEHYKEYICLLKKESLFDERPYRRDFSLAISKTLKPFYLMQVKEGSFLVKLIEPIIRMQLFNFHYIKEQGQFVLTHHVEESVSWGLEFSFPQFYQDRTTCQPIEILKDKNNPNTQLFKSVQKWMREATVPAPFMVDKKQQIAPFRLGKKCFKWINLYPGMRKHGLKILDSYASRSDNDRL